MVKRSIWSYKAVRKERDQAIRIFNSVSPPAAFFNSVEHPKQRPETSATVVVDFPHKDRCASVL